MSVAAHLIRSARVSAGLTQAELASRARTTQTAIARVERPGSNPKIRTVEHLLRASGHRLEVKARPQRATLDEGQIRAMLRLTPAERLESFSRSYANVRDLMSKVRPSHGGVA